MKGTIVCLVVASLIAGGVHAGESEVSLDVVSAYVFRGVTLNDGVVLQPGLSADGLPFGVSVWGNIDLSDYDAIGVVADDFSEIDLAFSYDLPLSVDPISLSVGYTEYTYPNGGVADRELSVGAALDVLLTPSVTVYYGIDGAIEQALYVEAAVGWENEINDKVTIGLDVAVGYVSPDGGEEGFSHVTASASVGFGILSASVTYVGQIDEDVLPDVDATTGAAGYDVDVFGMLGIAKSF